MNYYIGIDFGGTFIKGGVVNEKGEILFKDKIPTEANKMGYKSVIDNISSFILKLAAAQGKKPCQILGVGIGIPGMIDFEKGKVIISGNINWCDVSVRDEIQKATGIKTEIANDANVAALGEARFGAGSKYQNSVMLTLGTGVGSGIVIGGKIYAGNKSAGAEIGHMIIQPEGEACTCGNKGCLEAYASAQALIRETKKAIKENPNSLMNEVANKIDGKTAFDYYEIDSTAKKVVDNYVYYLSIGLINIANIFRPDAIILGGGVSEQGERLLKPLNERLKKNIFAKGLGPDVPVVIAKLKNDAGILGAAALVIN